MNGWAERALEDRQEGRIVPRSCHTGLEACTRFNLHGAASHTVIPVPRLVNAIIFLQIFIYTDLHVACDAHGSLLSHETQALALSDAWRGPEDDGNRVLIGTAPEHFA